MQPLVKIPLVDVRGHSPLELLFLYRQPARSRVTGTDGAAPVTEVFELAA